MSVSIFVCSSHTVILFASGLDLLGSFCEARELFALTGPNWDALLDWPAFNLESALGLEILILWQKLLRKRWWWGGAKSDPFHALLSLPRS